MSWSGMVEIPQGWQRLVLKPVVPIGELMAGPPDPLLQPQGGWDPHVASGDITPQLPQGHRGHPARTGDWGRLDTFRFLHRRFKSQPSKKLRPSTLALSQDTALGPPPCRGMKATTGRVVRMFPGKENGVETVELETFPSLPWDPETRTFGGHFLRR